MTRFDYAAAGIMILSALIGLARGAAREVTGIVAFVAAAVLALAGRRLTEPVAARLIHDAGVASVAAVLVVFLVLLTAFNILGGAVTRGVRASLLSGPDRAAGLAIGLARGWVVVGAVTLLIEAAAPIARAPAWITGARTYPLARSAARTLRGLAPRGWRLAQAAAPVVESPP